MQASTTFGRRGAHPEPAFAPPPATTPSFHSDDGSTVQTLQPPPSSVAVPWITLGILGVLVAAYFLELSVSAASGYPGRVSHVALERLGGLSRDLALDHGQLWRILTVSLLHLNLAHLAGNAVALVLVGLLLEPIVGRGWFALIYVIGAIGGAVGSIAMNSSRVLSVGASGAIMCLLACSLVMSLHTASFERRKRMRMLSLRVMIPALLPLSSTQGNFDYSAHAGGVVAGLALGGLLMIIWDENRPRPPLTLASGFLAGMGASASGLALTLAAMSPASASSGTPGLIPIDNAPTSAADWTAQAPKLAAQYPADPRPHLFKAVALIKSHDDAGAEPELQTALQSPLLAAPELPANFAAAIRSQLVGLYVRDGRRDDAKKTAEPLCAAPASVSLKLMALLRRAGICPPA